MNRAWVFLHEVSKLGKGGLIPATRILYGTVQAAEEIAKQEVNAGRVSTPDYYSKEIQRYEESALGSSRII